MEFYTSFCEKRPIRLCEATRKFAYESLYEHRYGLETRANYAVSIDGAEDFEDLTDIEKYNFTVRAIAEKAPIRICEGELISGAATLGLAAAMNHAVPATYNGKAVFGALSHLTVDFEKLIKMGIDGIKAEVLEAQRVHRGEREKAFLQSCLDCIESLDIWRKRYINALEEAGYRENAAILRRVPMQPPSNFREAVQSIWFVFAFLRLCGNWPGIGRIDKMLGVFLERDLESGLLTLDTARELLAHFFIKGCEWVAGGYYGSGDAQHYQNLVLAGIDENGNEVTNAVTYLVLDIVEELGISDFPITVRINEGTDESFIERIAEVMRFGNGILAVYGENTVISAMRQYGYSEKEARRFANDGCWEVQVPGRTRFCYTPFDSLQILQHITLSDYAEGVEFESFEQLYSRYIEDLYSHLEGIYRYHSSALDENGEWYRDTPCTVVSLFEEGCIAKGRSYLEGGPIYTVASPHIGGTADTVNSLYIIKKLVFEEKKCSFSEFMAVLRNNWEGNEALRRYVLSHYELYGNDNDEVDLLAARLLDDFAKGCKMLDGRCKISFPAGVSTFGRQIEWAPFRFAVPHGRKANEVLAGNLCPTPGTAINGATAVIRSHCKADLTKQVTGAALDIRLLPSDVRGKNGVVAIASLIKGFVRLGGFFMQIDVADAEILREAQKNPENYPSLAVRISGWNARFVTLSKEWQDMIIDNIEGNAQ
ncbi:MAG: hypothetical protein IKM32_05185 [Clostridia bacterium]|nr:hypothetical protein [Clostridia bacterium]